MTKESSCSCWGSKAALTRLALGRMQESWNRTRSLGRGRVRADRKLEREKLEIQEAAVKAAGCDVIRAEKRSGTTASSRSDQVDWALGQIAATFRQISRDHWPAPPTAALLFVPIRACLIFGYRKALFE
jgi:hypothetical protein